MTTHIDKRLTALVKAGQQHLLKGGLKGLEKESLRVTPTGRIAQTPHPRALGSALTHPYITTDYSEALIELITPPFADVADTLAFLSDLHGFVYRRIGDELLWASSMPCEIDGDASIPIAEYGSSNIGKMKHVYRHGLAWRYGRAMQSIAGIHFNYSLNEALWPVLQSVLGNADTLRRFIDAQYFGMIRNIKRHGWIVLYLFGTSPALCKSFFTGREALAKRFDVFDDATLYRPYATSLRMSDIGYRNDSQSELDISCNSLDEYVNSLAAATNTLYPDYQKIGVKVDGEYRQLNANILQIANEYYSSIRPKQLAASGERPTLALRRRGIGYVELRSVDLGAGHPAGVSEQQLRVLELFLLCCFLKESPSFERREKPEVSHNALTVACCGRTPGMMLSRDGMQLSLRDWARELIDEMAVIADILDDGEDGHPYRTALNAVTPAVDDADATPSAQMLQAMRERGESFEDHVLRLSAGHGDHFRNRPVDPSRTDEFIRLAEQSLQEQATIEAGDSGDFDQFVQQYFSQSLFDDAPPHRVAATMAPATQTQ